jgi:response regulator RpfG family c-di-GMP phosphodiesterase
MTSRLKQRHPEVPVVVITGYGTEAGERQARDLGVAGYLRKPLTPEMIVGNAERALQERQEMLEAIRRSALTMMQPAPAAETTAAVPVPEARGAANVAKNIGLFFAAPFIGLAYVLAFPFVGVWAIVKYGYQALTRRS